MPAPKSAAGYWAIMMELFELGLFKKDYVDQMVANSCSLGRILWSKEIDAKILDCGEDVL